MIRFKRLETPCGIHVYFQKMPKIVQSISLRWIMFVGSADDESVGSPGLYHWFEHVPFRGTRQFPDSDSASGTYFERHGGVINAHTTQKYTCYEAKVPTRLWRDALCLLTDLIAQPLMREEDIKAEREIIDQEIAGHLASAGGFANEHVSQVLWPDHPYGHSVLGSPASLDQMSANALRQAHQQGYSRCRAVLIAAGNIDQKALLAAVSECASTLPDTQLSERRLPASYGVLPPWQPGLTEIETPFESTIVCYLFPIPANLSKAQIDQWAMLGSVSSSGGLASPLMKIVREERRLAYAAHYTYRFTRDGGYCGFTAETRAENVDAVVEAFKDVLTGAHIRSEDQHAYALDALRGGDEMRTADPHLYTHIVEGSLSRSQTSKAIISHKELLRRLERVPRSQIIELLNTLTPDRAHTIIFRGTGKGT